MPAETKAEIHARNVADTLADAPRGRLGEITQGERALHEQNTVARATFQKAESQDEAVRNRMTASLAEMDAKKSLKVPEDSVKASGEMMSPDFMRGCRSYHLIDTLQNPSMISVIASEYRLDLATYMDSRVAELAVDAAQSAQAANSLEKMLCHQMAAAHRAAMKMLGQSVRVSNYPVEVARLSNAAARMMQVYQEGLLTLQKLRTGGKQTVVVQHVQISEGGQAVIAGNMASRPANSADGETEC